MKRKIVQIDEERCNGCGACVSACHEGAIGMVDGKARLLRDDYCDGLGDCLPVCPTDAISFIEQEVESAPAAAPTPASGSEAAPGPAEAPQSQPAVGESQLGNWPVQIKLAPVEAPYFNGAKLLIAADCTAYAHGDFHNRFIKGHVVLIGCPKLDAIDYSEKLTQIFSLNNIAEITVTRMQVPCCGGLEFAVKRALENCGKQIPCTVVTIAPDGTILAVN